MKDSGERERETGKRVSSRPKEVVLEVEPALK